MIKDSKKDDRNERDNVLSHFLNFTNSISNEYRTFLVKKCERLASALYVITGFIEPQDPVRLKLRSTALDLITQSSQPNQSSSEVFGARCAEIAALLETAKSGGLVSQMNASLICDEYASLAIFFSDHRPTIMDQGNYVGKDRTPVPKGLKGQLMSASSPLASLRDNKNDSHKRQDERKSLIVKVFNKKDNVSIKDISSEINGYSEKTIQRDLISLVREGILKREGERRWSTYHKVTPEDKKLKSPEVDL